MPFGVVSGVCQGMGVLHGMEIVEGEEAVLGVNVWHYQPWLQSFPSCNANDKQ